jgi:hypothetical protein
MATSQDDMLNRLNGGEPVEDIPNEDDIGEVNEESSPEPVLATEQPAAEPEEAEFKEERPEPRVSLHALHEERERRKESERQLQSLRDQAVRMEERFAAFQEKFSAPAEPEVQFDEDPATYLRREQEKLAAQQQELQQFRQQQETNTQQQQQYQHFYQHVTANEQEFAQTEAPDYYEAVDFVRGERIKELAVIGFPQAEAEQRALAEAQFIARQAVQDGESPARRFYNLAKVRGWQSKSPSDNVETGADPVAPPAADMDDVQKLETVRRGVERSQGLGSGGESAGRMTLAQLSELDDDDFEKATSGRNWEKLWSSGRR